ncbi:hypothetical protein CALVIDRAFT_602366 [Calocera viscosa TUFC12733]|uniref:Zn(2)-C6 fungal-type domain-containing protein n=1 Tax=Calocera viscosa (strain TUFC12733) TaxID=1330018 RepID=A0A167H4K8_CALVF|nr:hypothetical protein CALVIDRAFT_602366 [Calocera viscosa TUFC12733]
MSTSATTSGAHDKPANPETVEQSEDENSGASEDDQGSEETTKEREKGAGQPASGSNSQHPSVTYGQQAEDARRAYAQYAAQLGVTSAQLAAQQGLAAAWGYPGHGGAYYPAAYIPVAPNGAPFFPSYYVPSGPPGGILPYGIPPLAAGNPVAPVSQNKSAPARANAVGEYDRNRKIVPDKVFIACDYCRRRKLRCNGEQPKCSVCVRYSEDCVYDKKRRTRGPGRKSLLALGIGAAEVTKPRKRARKSDTAAESSSASPSSAQQTTANSIAQALATMPAPFPLPAPSTSPNAAPQPMPIPAPGPLAPGSALEGNALTAAAIMNALPALQAYGQQNGQPYPMMYRPMHSPPMPPPPMPSLPMPSPPGSVGAAKPVVDNKPKTQSPKPGKKKAANSSPSGQKRKRGRQVQADS